MPGPDAASGLRQESPRLRTRRPRRGGWGRDNRLRHQCRDHGL